MNGSSKVFFSIASVVSLIAIYNFTFQTPNTLHSAVLGEKDSLETKIDASFSELDSFLDSELSLETIEDVKTGTENEPETDTHFEAELFEDELFEQELGEIQKRENELHAKSTPDPAYAPTEFPTTNTYRVSKIKKLFLLIPVKIDTVQTISESGIVLEEKQTVLGKLLDLLSF